MVTLTRRELGNEVEGHFIFKKMTARYVIRLESQELKETSWYVRGFRGNDPLRKGLL